jgi:thioredoxin-like negative regulator of GroEL
MQATYLQQLRAVKSVAVETIDVLRQPERAAQFNIMTLPTTVVVAGNGNVKQINLGVTDANKLAQQLEK